MGNVSPLKRLASKNGIELSIREGGGFSAAFGEGEAKQVFPGETPREAINAALAAKGIAPEPDKTVSKAIAEAQAADTGKPPKPKKPKKKTAAKKKKAKRPAREEGDGDEDDEGEGEGAGSVVKRKYRQQYQPTENSCGDPMAEAMRDATHDDNGKIDMAKLKAVADANGIDLKRWAGRNIGMIRMNMSNVMRGMLRRGDTITIGKQTFKPEKAAKKTIKPGKSDDKAA